MSFITRIPDYRRRVEATLDRRLAPATEFPQRLHSAMRYAALAPGKRIRPLLVYATGETMNVPPDRLDGSAAAVELIHAYSLVHDDLPPMDDDALRRGRPTCHRAFDEATAILAGDALQTLAFEVLTSDRSTNPSPEKRLWLIWLLAQASGSRGMVGGQVVDIEAEGQVLGREALERMHMMKTGALIRASVLMGANSANDPDETALAALDRYAHHIGLAFQIQDDILDATGKSEQLGKVAGADAARGKPTYTAILGLEGARKALNAVYVEALEALEPFGERSEPLRSLAEMIVVRDH